MNYRLWCGHSHKVSHKIQQTKWKHTKLCAFEAHAAPGTVCSVVEFFAGQPRVAIIFGLFDFSGVYHLLFRPGVIFCLSIITQRLSVITIHPQIFHVHLISVLLLLGSWNSVHKTYREIMQFILGDILYHICNATEDEGDRNVINRKHSKNLNVLSMMGICRLWNDQIHRLNGLFTDIAFDTTNYVTISMAAKLPEKVETQSSNLHVYARCIAWDGGQAQKVFLSHLWLQSWRFVCFEIEHASPLFIAYFNLLAPRLLQLVHRSPLPRGLFSSSLTSLRVLDVSVEKYFPWQIATFSNLITPRLENSHPAHHFCATSLFDLVRHAHHLGELQLTSFLCFSSGSETRHLICMSLKLICFIQCNLEFLLQHLQFLNANSFVVKLYGISSAGKPDLPPFRDMDYFSPLQAYPIPILEQHPLTNVIAHMEDFPTDKVYFKLCLQCEASCTVDLTVVFRKEVHWEAYFQSSVNEILQRANVSARIDLSVFHHPPLSLDHPPSPHRHKVPSSLIDTPLLQLPQVFVLRIDYSLVRGIVLHLADPENMVLPNLKCYLFNVEMLPTSVDEIIPETVTCLQFWFMTGSPFAIQYWTLDGEIQSDMIFPTCADSNNLQIIY